MGLKARLALGLLIALPASAMAKGKPSPWDGTWTGAWGGSAATSIIVVDGQVAEYKYKGSPVPITKSSVSGKTVSFGAEHHTVKATMTGPGSASATWNDDSGHSAAATLSKK